MSDVDDYFEDVPPRHREAATALRSLLAETLPTATETLKWNSPCYVVDGENTCYVSVHEDHVNLGFFDGASLPDPDGRLEGTGASMRHVKIEDADEVYDPALRQLVERAGESARRSST